MWCPIRAGRALEGLPTLVTLHANVANGTLTLRTDGQPPPWREAARRLSAAGFELTTLQRVVVQLAEGPQPSGRLTLEWLPAAPAAPASWRVRWDAAEGTVPAGFERLRTGGRLWTAGNPGSWILEGPKAEGPITLELEGEGPPVRVPAFALGSLAE